MLIPELKTERLMLRAPDLERDLEYMVRYAADAEAMRFIGTGETHGSEQAREWLEGYLRDWDRIGYGRWTVTLADTREPIGNCGFILWREGEADERPELAYGYLRDAWGRGYATEAAAAVLQWTFTTLPVDEVVALTHPGNAASQRVLAKLGFESAGEVAPSHGRTMAMFVATRPTTRRDPPTPLAEGPGRVSVRPKSRRPPPSPPHSAATRPRARSPRPVPVWWPQR